MASNTQTKKRRVRRFDRDMTEFQKGNALNMLYISYVWRVCEYPQAVYLTMPMPYRQVVSSIWHAYARCGSGRLRKRLVTASSVQGFASPVQRSSTTHNSPVRMAPPSGITVS